MAKPQHRTAAHRKAYAAIRAAQAFSCPGGAMATDTETAAERIEAETRIAMAAVTKARGYDTQRVRDDDLAFVDSLLDSWLDLRG